MKGKKQICEELEACDELHLSIRITPSVVKDSDACCISIYSQKYETPLYSRWGVKSKKENEGRIGYPRSWQGSNDKDKYFDVLIGSKSWEVDTTLTDIGVNFEFMGRDARCYQYNLRVKIPDELPEVYSLVLRKKLDDYSNMDSEEKKIRARDLKRRIKKSEDVIQTETARLAALQAELEALQS